MSEHQNRVPRQRKKEAGEVASPEQQERAHRAAALLRSWMQEDDGYDAEIWPLVEEELKDITMRCRE